MITGANHLLLAPSRSGKTHYAFHELFCKAQMAVFVDPKNTDDYLRAAARRLDVNAVDHVEFLASMNPQPYIILRGHPEREMGVEVEKLIKWVVSIKVRNPAIPQITVVVDECWRFMSKMVNQLNSLQRSYCEGRGYGISTVLIAQHPRFIPNDLIENANYIYTWPAVDEAHRSQGLNPVITQYFLEHALPEIPPECFEWCKQPYHGLKCDWGSWWKINPDGSIAGREVKHDETPSQPVAPEGPIRPVGEVGETNPPGVNPGGSVGQGPDQNRVLKP